MIEISNINRSISQITEELQRNGRVSQAWIREFDRMLTQKDLQIGLIGKMKTGKTAIINALLFGKDVLYSSDEPATVTLTKIVYGESDAITIEFLSREDIAAIEAAADYSGDDDNAKAKQEAAQEILDALPDGYEKYLDTIKNDASAEELEDFISSSGDYSGLVKCVTIQLHNDLLKNITIIDTPGFNDPVVSRGETTKELISGCHVILFVHEPTGYDLIDAALLNEQLEYAGIAKMIDVFNRMDLRSDSTPTDWNTTDLTSFLERRAEYVNEKTHPKASQLVDESMAVAICALMARCANIPERERSNFIKVQIGKYEERFPELAADATASLEQALLQHSGLPKLAELINDVSKDAAEYLRDKPMALLLGKLVEVSALVETEIEVEQSRLAGCRRNADENKKYLEELGSFIQRIKTQVMNASLEHELLELVDKKRVEIQNMRRESADSISKEKFPQPDLIEIGKGVTKANVSNYNLFLSNFQDKLRHNHSHLKESFQIAANRYLRNKMIALQDHYIKEEVRNDFEAAMNNRIKERIAQLHVEVEPYAVSQLPDKKGKSEQWSKFRTDFLSKYDDKTINEGLKKFDELASEIGNTALFETQLQELYAAQKRLSDMNPVQLEEEISKIEAQVLKLKAEKEWLDTQIETLKTPGE